MITFFVFFYLVLMFMYLAFFCKKPKQSEVLIKVKNKSLYLNNKNQNLHLFCSKNSKEYEIFQKLINNQFVFKKNSELNKYILPLKNSGLDPFLPIFKLEIYKNEKLGNYYKLLYNFLNLDKQNTKINLLLFFDDNSKLCKAKKIIKLLNYKNILVRFYNCLEINFELLASINFFNVNKEESGLTNKTKKGFAWCNYNKIKHNKNFLSNKKENVFYTKKSSLIKLDSNNLPQNEKIIKIQDYRVNQQNNDIVESSIDYINKDNSLCNKFFVSNNGNTQYFNNFSYKDFCFSSEIIQGNLICKLTKTYNYEYCCDVFLLNVTNINSNDEKLKFGVELRKNTSIFQNDIVVFNKKDNKTSFFNLKDKINLNLYRFLDFLETNLTNYFLYSEIVVEAKSSKQISFLASKTNEFMPKDINKLDFSLLFNETCKIYNNINLIKVLSENKTINYLINEFLPNRIIKNLILGVEKSKIDFFSLINKKLDLKLCNEKMVKDFPQKFFLAKANLYNIYFNLIYFYFGVYPTKVGVSFNSNKSLILDNATISFKVSGKKHILNLKNDNLKNEIKIDDIKYTNLDFLNFNSFQKDNLEVYY